MSNLNKHIMAPKQSNPQFDILCPIVLKCRWIAS